MSISRADENDLLLPLHAGPHEASPWSTFLARLRRRARADAAALLLAMPDADEGDVRALTSNADGIGDEIVRLIPYVRRHLRPGRAYRTHDIDEPIDGHVCVVRADDAGGGPSGWMVVSRRREDFSAGDGALLTTLAPHLSVALQTMATLSRHRLRDAAADQALDRLGVGWLLLDAEVRILDADPVAEAMLADGLGMHRLAGERLHAGEDALRTLAALARDAASAPQLVMLGGSPPMPMMARRLGDRPSTLVGHLRRATVGTSGRAAALRSLYDLAPSEARLALALADGRSLAEAAATQRLTIETARNYSKRVYAKTGTRGQADLVRLILCGIAALA